MTAHTETELDGGPTLRWFLALTQFLLILDTAILNVAVPVIGTDLSLTPAAETWVLNAYIVAFGGVLLLTGSVADAVGQGRVLVAGLTVLAIGAGFGALGQTGEVVIASRAVQGIGAAMAAASAMALVFSRFNGPARRKTLGLFASMAGLGGATGTALSGVLTETLGWRSAFWLNVAAAVALAIWACTLPNIFAQGRRRKLNILGGILITAALASTAYAITSTSEMGLNKHVTIAGLIAVITFVAFVLLERRVANPLISPTIWRIPPLLRGLLLAGTGQWVLVPVFLFISLYLQRVLGYEPLAAGMSLLPMAVAICFVAPLVPRAVGRWGVYQVMGSAFVIVALAGAWLSLVSTEGSFLTDILGPTLLLALGLPTISVTTNVVTAENSPPNEPGVTSGLLTTSQQFGATLGLAAWVAIASVGPDPGPQTLADGYARAFLVSVVVMILAAVVALWSLRKARPEPASTTLPAVEGTSVGDTEVTVGGSAGRVAHGNLGLGVWGTSERKVTLRTNVLRRRGQLRRLLRSARRVQELGDLRDGGGPGVDVAHRCAGRLVAGLGHDQLQRDALLAEVRGCGVAELVELPSGGVLQEDGVTTTSL